MGIEEIIARETIQKARYCLICKRPKANVAEWGVGIYDGPMLTPPAERIGYLVCPVCLALGDIGEIAEVEIFKEMPVGRSH